MAMRLLLQQNIKLRHLQILELGLESEYFDTFLVRTEKRLKKLKYQKGLSLIRNVYKDDGVQYRASLDWLVAVVSPEWRRNIIDFYTHGSYCLGESVNFEDITKMDMLMEGTVIELTGMYEELVKSRMLTRGHTHEGPDQFMQALALENIRTTVTPALPKAPIHPKREALAS